MTALAGPRPTPMRRRRVAALALALAGLASGGLVVAPSGPVGATGRAPSVSASALVGLHRGDRGASVTALQQRLVAFGYVLSVDGVFGSATEHAVAHFQRANGLTASGVVGATTARYLGVATGSTAASASATGSSASNAPASSSGGLHRGSEGSSVRALQARLARFGYVVEHDGVFGHLTERAVEHFQRANGLTPSGVVDTATARDLGLTGARLVRQHIDASSSSVAAAATGGGLRRGSQGSSVRALQARLAGFGYVVEHDGVFGHLTERAVEHFQRANGLTPSGVVDTATARNLGLTSATTGSTTSTSGASGGALVGGLARRRRGPHPASTAASRLRGDRRCRRGVRPVHPGCGPGLPAGQRAHGHRPGRLGDGERPRHRWLPPVGHAVDADPGRQSGLQRRCDRRRRGDQPARRRLPLRHGQTGHRLRLLGPHRLGLGAGRGAAAVPVGAAVRHDPPRAGHERPARRPGVLPLADQPRRDVHRQQPDHRRDAARHRCDRPRPSTGDSWSASGGPGDATTGRRVRHRGGADAGRHRRHGRSDGAHRHRRDRVVVLDRRPAPG